VGWSDDDAVALTGSTNWRAQWGPSVYSRHTVWSGIVLRGPGATSLGMLMEANSGLPYTTTVRNAGNGPNYYNLDLNLAKAFTLPFESGSGPKWMLTSFIYGQDILNSRNFTSPLGGTLTHRKVELGLRLAF
jgi:hypothetical protein